MPVGQHDHEQLAGHDGVADLHANPPSGWAPVAEFSPGSITPHSPSTIGACIGVTRTTVVGREPTASQKMLSVPAESLVFPVIYRLHRIGRWLRHDEQRHPPRPILLLSQLEAAGACLRLLSFFPAFPGVPPRCFAFPPDALSCAPPPSAAPSFRLRHLPSCGHRKPGLPAPCVLSCRDRPAAASTRSGAPSRRRWAPNWARVS